MFANFTEETCTGTGATLALAGAIGNKRPFSRGFSDGDLVSYVVEDSGGVITASGIGTYNSTGNTITRNDTENDNGTTTDRNPATNITLSAGTHTVRCDVVQGRFLGSKISRVNFRSDSKYVVDAWATDLTGNAASLGSGWVSMSPFSVVETHELVGLGCTISTVSTTGANFRLGIYTLLPDGNLSLLGQTVNMDVSLATGYNTGTFVGGNIIVSPSYNNYFLAVGTDTNMTMVTVSTAFATTTPFGGFKYDRKVNHIFKTSGFTASGFPPSITALTHNDTQAGVGIKRIFGVQV